MRKKNDLGSALDKLASSVVSDALKEGVSLDTRLDALKVASAHFVATTKVKKHEDEDDGSDFNSFKSKINAAENNVVSLKGNE
jgi:aromatic ring-opening dioxygenase catalytic subunit (LigB family)